MPCRIAVDIGGTFTDLVLEDTAGSALRATKVLSTPGNLVEGVIGALRRAGVRGEDVALCVHGTTAGLNALLERRGARVALVTTDGFRDTYLIGRGNRPEMYNLRYRKPAPLLDRSAIFEVRERMAADGSELHPVDVSSVSEVAAAIRAGGFDVVAVSLLHAYANPAHEQEVAEALAGELDVPIVVSHRVAPVWREYERTSTTVTSAYVTPIMTNYLARLREALTAEGFHVPVYITESNGGVMGTQVAADRAVLTLFSGPVGGVVGTRAAGEGLELGNLISADVGGTSFDVSLVRAGEATLQSDFELQGLPVLAPSVEVHTIGAGGGSLIREVGGALRVGPESAGATPGPACYGNGGTEPTITDANVVLGRLPSGQLLGGNMPLDVDAARRALQSVGDKFGLSAEEVAEQALEIVHFAMAEAIRELTVERGLDPHDFTLCAFGGAGGLHATALADELGISRVLVPAMPGAFSAWGMLRGDIRHDAATTFFRSMEAAAGEVSEVARRLEADVRGLLELDGVSSAETDVEVAADLRYVGQEYTLTVPLSRVELADLIAHREAVEAGFHQAHDTRYGHSRPHEPVEFVAVRVTGRAALDRDHGTEAAANGHDAAASLGETTIRINGQPVTAALHHRAAITEPVSGPAVVLEDTCTTVVPSTWSVAPTADGHLILEHV